MFLSKQKAKSKSKNLSILSVKKSSFPINIENQFRNRTFAKWKNQHLQILIYQSSSIRL